MVGYINSVRDREYKVCTPEIFEQLVQSPMVTTHIEEYRKGNEKSKSLLPAFLFQGYDPNVLLGKRGSRLAKALKPTGFFIMDFDHIESPHKVYDTFLKRLPSLGFDLYKDVALAHVTPSGKGLRLVLVTPKGMTIEAAQEWVAKVMEIECDAVVKDLSRLSFCPQASDVLYINKVLLFGEIKEASPKGEGENETDNPVVVIDFVASLVEETPREDVPTAQVGAAAVSFPPTFQGIPYEAIVENLKVLHGGTPQVGNRNNFVFNMASDLAKITDRSQPWIESLLPNPGLPDDEYKTTIAGVCRKAQEAGLSYKLKQAIAMSRTYQETVTAVTADNISDEPQMPEHLPQMVEHLISKVMPRQRAALANAIFPALATYVSDAQFYAHDNKPFELSLMAVVCGESSCGKGEVTTVNEVILDRINKRDAVYRKKLKEYNSSQKNKKSNEKGKDLTHCPIQHIYSDCTRAAFLQRLSYAQEGDGDRTDLPTFTDV